MEYSDWILEDAKHCRPGRKNSRIDCGTSSFVNACRPARNDQATMTAKLFRRSFAGQDFRINAEFTDFAGDEVGVLAAGIEYGDLGVGDVIGHLG